MTGINHPEEMLTINKLQKEKKELQKENTELTAQSEAAKLEISILTATINLLTADRSEELKKAVKFGFITQAERLGISGYMTNFYADEAAEKYSEHISIPSKVADKLEQSK